MDCNKFPHQLFPGFYNTGPPNTKFSVNVGSWGLYNQALEVNHCLPRNDPGQLAEWKFDTQFKVKGKTWKAVEPIPAPLRAPSKVCRIPSSPVRSPADFTQHMQNFYLAHSEDAFGTMSSVLGEHFYFGEGKIPASKKKNVVRMSRMKHFLSIMNHRKCPRRYFGKRARSYINLFGDVIHDIPPFLLAELLREELKLQSERAQFNEMATGGALGYFPVRVTDSSQEGCLVFPEENSLKFHKVVLEFNNDEVPQLSMSDSHSLTTKLSGAIRQISVGSMQENVHIGVRSDYHCGVWLACPTKRVMPLEVIQTEHIATCICVSPHIPGEVLVASESGAAYLWTVGKGLSKFRHEDDNLYFNAQSSWRWCDFSAHPKVMQYTDRTGVELTDTRSSNKCSYTLFRIGETPNCRSGERVILSKYLNDLSAYHHLVSTQHSIYIMDERFPCVPMLKWDHMMMDPPVFAQVLAGSQPGRTNKVFLGSQRSQELMFLQYCGGGEAACSSLGPPLKLSCPADSLSHLRAQVPHKQQQAQQRLAEPAAGFIVLQHNKPEECLCVLQLTETGDIFYQTLTNHPDEDGGDAHQQRPFTGSEEEYSVTSELPNSMLNSRQCTEEVSMSGRAGTSCCEVEAVISDAEIVATTSDNIAHSRDLMKPQRASKEVLSRWGWWLKTLFGSSGPPSEQVLSHWTRESKGLISCEATRKNPLEEDQLQRLRQDLQQAMKRKDVLIHGATYLRHLEVVPLPDSVVPADWSDSLSQRLSVSWEGHWKSWWEDKLGMNREAKVEALRRKRQRQKRARARRRVALSESFVSSVSYQSDLDDLSGWSSSRNSQGACSDMDSSAHSLPFSDALQDSPRANVLPNRNRSEFMPLASVESVDNSPTQLKLAARKINRPEQDYLASLFGSQGHPEVQEDSGLQLLVGPLSLGSSISLSQRNPCVVASNKGSQAMQPRKKKPRMGF